MKTNNISKDRASYSRPPKKRIRMSKPAQQSDHHKIDPEELVGSKSIEYKLWQDIRKIFKEKDRKKLRTNRLISCLCDDCDSPWSTFGKGGKPISARKISFMLRPFGIQSCDIRFNSGVFKGYRKSSFTKKYLNSQGITV